MLLQFLCKIHPFYQFAQRHKRPSLNNLFFFSGELYWGFRKLPLFETAFAITTSPLPEHCKMDSSSRFLQGCSESGPWESPSQLQQLIKYLLQMNTGFSLKQVLVSRMASKLQQKQLLEWWPSLNTEGKYRWNTMHCSEHKFLGCLILIYCLWAIYNGKL